MTKIEWTSRTWNPIIGCLPCSDGCKYCYAERWSVRLSHINYPSCRDYLKIINNNKFNGNVFLRASKLKDPLNYKKPSMIFVCSMSDLFYADFEAIDNVFEIIRQTPHHIYQILTKRADRMADYFYNHVCPDNCWLGVTIENNHYYNRLNNLKMIKAPIRFISFEPLLGSVEDINLNNINWVIIGGETGARARIMREEWVKEIFRKCNELKIPYFFKKWGSKQSHRSKYQNKKYRIFPCHSL
jgi:protein gp37